MATNNTAAATGDGGKTGRPTKRTPEVQKRIVNALRLGMTYRRAASVGGISYETFNEWRKDSAEFSDAIKKAEDDMVGLRLAAIIRASSRSWTAAAWLLERRFPDEYGRRRVELTGKDGKPIETKISDIERMSADEIEHELAELEREEAAAATREKARPRRKKSR